MQPGGWGGGMIFALTTWWTISAYIRHFQIVFQGDENP
jgi:hypothetical protein